MSWPLVWEEIDVARREVLEQSVRDLVDDFLSGDAEEATRVKDASPSETEEWAHTLWDVSAFGNLYDLREAPGALRVRALAHLHAVYWRYFGAEIEKRGGKWDPSIDNTVFFDGLDDSVETETIADLVHAGKRMHAITLVRERHGLSAVDAARRVDAMTRSAMPRRRG